VEWQYQTIDKTTPKSNFNQTRSARSSESDSVIVSPGGEEDGEAVEEEGTEEGLEDKGLRTTWIALCPEMRG
jgi:predicted glycosyltransferase